jgi:hypothetical protein
MYFVTFTWWNNRHQDEFREIGFETVSDQINRSQGIMASILGILDSSAKQWYQDVVPTQNLSFPLSYPYSMGTFGSLENVPVRQWRSDQLAEHVIRTPPELVAAPLSRTWSANPMNFETGMFLHIVLQTLLEGPCVNRECLT